MSLVIRPHLQPAAMARQLGETTEAGGKAAGKVKAAEDVVPHVVAKAGGVLTLLPRCGHCLKYRMGYSTKADHA